MDGKQCNTFSWHYMGWLFFFFFSFLFFKERGKSHETPGLCSPLNLELTEPLVNIYGSFILMVAL